MLCLTDKRWSQLSTFFGEPEDLPKIIDKWSEVIGSDQEKTLYERELFDQFLHQGTITNAAFAMVPWLTYACQHRQTPYVTDYLIDIAMTEANRLSYGVYWNREDTEATPDWLMPEYHQAIRDCQGLIDAAIEREPNPIKKQYLRALKPALYGNGELAWAQWRGEA